METKNKKETCCEAMKKAKPRNVAGYFLLGLCNNVGFVIMVAGAKTIAEAGVAIVYLVNVLPIALIKVTAPLWFDRISYNFRLVVCVLLQAASFLCVALSDDLGTQLVGVALGSASCGIGEVSFLAMAYYFHSATMLAAWSSGTGLAGIVGYLWVIIVNVVAAASFEITILTALIWPAVWVVAFFFVMDLPNALLGWDACGLTMRCSRCERRGDRDLDYTPLDKSTLSLSDNENDSENTRRIAKTNPRAVSMLDDITASINSTDLDHAETNASVRHGTSSPSQQKKGKPLDCATRTRTIAVLWKYMVPLFLVYFSEYAMQSGAWSAIGFPVSSKDARKDFYLKANLCYQVRAL